MKKGNGLLAVVVLIGIAVAIWASNRLYDARIEMAPYEAQAPVQFYAGFDKLMSNVSWITLVQWEAGSTIDKEHCEALYTKLNSLTNLDPLFADAYLDGSLSLASYRPDLSLQLLQKGLRLGLGHNWKMQCYTGLVEMWNLKKSDDAATAFSQATKCADCPDYVYSLWLTARTGGQDESDPIAAMNSLVGFETQLTANDDQVEKNMAIKRVLLLGQQTITDCDTNLQSTTDPAARQTLLARKAQAQQIITAVNNQPPTTEPSNVPAPAANSSTGSPT